jgi:hypothetical protein
MLTHKGLLGECRQLLTELLQRNEFSVSTGYASLLAGVREAYAQCTGYRLKLLLRLLKAGGYVRSGKTKQGTQIVSEGLLLLQRLEGKI